MNKPNPEIVLFDWDGTLVDTRYALWDAMNKTLIEMERPTLEYSENAETPHFPRAVYLSKLFGKDAEKANEVFLRNINSGDVSKVKLYDGVRQLLDLLQNNGHKMGVVSNKVSTILRKEIDFFDLTQYFKIVVGSGDTSENKPSAKPVHHALNFLGAKPCSRNIVLVGDSITDLQCATSSGIGFIRYGERKMDGLESSSIAVTNHNDLMQFFGYSS